MSIGSWPRLRVTALLVLQSLAIACTVVPASPAAQPTAADTSPPQPAAAAPESNSPGADATAVPASSQPASAGCDNCAAGAPASQAGAAAGSGTGAAGSSVSQAGAAADSGGGSGSSSAGQPGAAAGGGGGGRAGAAALSGGAGAPAGAGGAAGTGAAGTSAPEERTYEGTWSGKTSQGGDFSFSVDGATVRQLKIRYIVDPNNDCHSPYVDHVIHTASPIISGFWEYKVTDGWTHDVTCDFQTASSARGTYDAKAQIKNPDGSVACNLASKGTWTATKQ